MTEISMAEYLELSNGMDGFCEQWTRDDRSCTGCPCDGRDQCLLSTIKELLQ